MIMIDYNSIQIRMFMIFMATLSHLKLHIIIRFVEKFT